MDKKYNRTICIRSGKLLGDGSHCQTKDILSASGKVFNTLRILSSRNKDVSDCSDSDSMDTVLLDSKIKLPLLNCEMVEKEGVICRKTGGKDSRGRVKGQDVKLKLPRINAKRQSLVSRFLSDSEEKEIREAWTDAKQIRDSFRVAVKYYKLHAELPNANPHKNTEDLDETGDGTHKERSYTFSTSSVQKSIHINIVIPKENNAKPVRRRKSKNC